MAAGIICCALCLRYFPELKNKIDNYPLTNRVERTVDMEGVTEIQANGELVRVIVESDTSTPATLSGRQVDLNNIEVEHDGNKLILTEKPAKTENEICFDCHLSTVSLTVATSSKLIIKAENDAVIIDRTEERLNDANGLMEY